MHTLYTEKQDIINWLDKYRIKNYALVPDAKYGYVVDVDGVLYLAKRHLKSINVKFNHVRGSFFCNSNQLTSLLGAPNKVDGDVDCEHNELVSLEGAPQIISGSFSCRHNNLTDLIGGPQNVGEGYGCASNQLKTLEGAPKQCTKNFSCSYNQLTSLKGAPEFVGGTFDCEYNQITNFDDFPKKIGDNNTYKVGHDIDLSYNNLQNTRNTQHLPDNLKINIEHNPELKISQQIKTTEALKVAAERDELNSNMVVNQKKKSTHKI